MLIRLAGCLCLLARLAMLPSYAGCEFCLYCLAGYGCWLPMLAGWL
jgi:hypothetical protein